jgi:hypothetical protein
MTSLRSLYFLVLITPVCVAADNSDAVNERIPVSRAEMELHWKLDCNSSWGQLKQVAHAHQGAQGCEVASGLLRQLQLCAFIYQPPGSPAAGACPDYQSAYRAAGQGDCVALGLLVESAAKCLY